MILPRSLRMEMLRKEWNVSQQQIASAVRSGIRAKSQRRTTLGNLGKTEKVEEMIEGATKQLLRTLFLRKSTSKRAQELEDEIQRVNNQRNQLVLEENMKGEFSDSESPWTAELLDDETEAEASRQDIFTSPTPPATRRDLDSSSEKKDDRPRIPMRGGSDLDIDMDESAASAKSAEDVAVHHTQSTGESASQVQKLPLKIRVGKPMITAVEPEDDIIGTEATEAEQLQKAHVDC